MSGEGKVQNPGEYVGTSLDKLPSFDAQSVVGKPQQEHQASTHIPTPHAS